MSKIVVIKGSARKGGNSNSMADAFIEAAKGLGHEIERYQDEPQRLPWLYDMLQDGQGMHA